MNLTDLEINSRSLHVYIIYNDSAKAFESRTVSDARWSRRQDNIFSFVLRNYSTGETNKCIPKTWPVTLKIE